MAAILLFLRGGGRRNSVYRSITLTLQMCSLFLM